MIRPSIRLTALVETVTSRRVAPIRDQIAMSRLRSIAAQHDVDGFPARGWWT